MLEQAVKKETEVLVQCTSCKDIFYIDVTTNKTRKTGKARILKFEPHPHIVNSTNHHGARIRCHCGGELRFFRENK